MDQVRLAESWKVYLGQEFEKPYMKKLKEFLVGEYQRDRKIFPAGSQYFAALDTTPLECVKVVILGQDPYHDHNQAHGLSFSVNPGIPVPPSLVNIYKELATDVEFKRPNHGYLLDWAEQGVLLLNAVLTVEAHKAGSHRNRGWEQFTDQVIRTVSDHAGPTVFVLWGGYARKKTPLIDAKRHLIIEAPHPSPLSAHRGFFGSRPFSQINRFLEQQGRSPIRWQLADRH